MNKPELTVQELVIYLTSMTSWGRALEIIRTLCRTVYTLAIFGGCAHLVFYRAESGWLFALAAALMIFRKGI